MDSYKVILKSSVENRAIAKSELEKTKLSAISYQLSAIPNNFHLTFGITDN
jgi:hypothetical protein